MFWNRNQKRNPQVFRIVDREIVENIYRMRKERSLETTKEGAEFFRYKVWLYIYDVLEFIEAHEYDAFWSIRLCENVVDGIWIIESGKHIRNDLTEKEFYDICADII